jgi:hypothetical protein
MRRSFHLLALMAVIVMVVPASSARAQYPVAAPETTIQDLLGLQAAGMTDDILIGLIQSSGTVFTLTADDLIYLRQQGLTERVLLAMLNTRRLPPPAVVPQQVAVPLTQARPEPVVVNVDQDVRQSVTVERESEPRRVRTQVVPVAVPVPVRGRRTAPRVEAKPVYWGFGGQRRPDSWDPPPTRARTPTPEKKTVPKGRGGGG